VNKVASFFSNFHFKRYL